MASYFVTRAVCKPAGSLVSADRYQESTFTREGNPRCDELWV